MSTTTTHTITSSKMSTTTTHTITSSTFTPTAAPTTKTSSTSTKTPATSTSSTGSPVCAEPGWITLYDSCYLVSPTKMFFYEAQQYCVGKGGYLAEIQSEDEQNRVQAVLNSLYTYWIGLSDAVSEGHFVWQHSMTPLEWSDWLPGEPDPVNGGSEDCVGMHEEGGRWGWNDMPCNTN